MRKLAKWLVLLALVAACAVWIIVSNGRYEIVEYTVASDRLPAAFEGFRIAQISDLHSRSWENLATDVAAGDPDIIVISGDFVSHGDTQLPTELVKNLVEIAPVYYATGNHESGNKSFPAMREEMKSLGVQVLENSSVGIEVREEYADRSEVSRIRISGIADPGSDYPRERLREKIDSALSATVDGDDVFTILIAHRPEYKMLYEAHSVDVVFSGHAHGGAFRIPLIGEIWAPGQGFFPAYVGGVYESEYSALVVSRGLGTSREPFRVNCPYELVFCTLTQG